MRFIFFYYYYFAYSFKSFFVYSFPCFQNPYPMDFHKSPVTYCAYFADCPNDLIPAFYSVGAMGTKLCGCSDKVYHLKK